MSKPKKKEIKPLPPLFDLQALLEEQKDLKRPTNFEEWLVLTLRGVVQKLELEGLTDPQVVKIDKGAERLKMVLQAKKQGKLVQLELEAEMPRQRPKPQFQPSTYVRVNFSKEGESIWPGYESSGWLWEVYLEQLSFQRRFGGQRG